MRDKTRFSERLGLTHPIVQGPFGGGLSSVALASTVSNAGGLGSFGADFLDGRGIRRVVTEMRQQTTKPFAINLWVPIGPAAEISDEAFDATIALFEPYYRTLKLPRPERPPSFGQDFAEQVEAILEARPPVFSFVYGVPDGAVLDECRKRGIATVGTATTVDEAVELENAGVDAVVASGFEAGGHKGSWLRPPEQSMIGTLSLVPQVVDSVSLPVIAAGGIADARGLRAASALGAQGVQIGTAFLACEESGASPEYRKLLFSSSGKDTTLTRVFTGRLARSMRNSFSAGMEPHEPDLPSSPIQNWFAGTIKAAAIAQGRVDLTSLWASQSTPLLRHRHARDVMAALVGALSETQI